MANLTLSGYVETTLSYMNEDRDTPEDNQKIREADVIRAINAGRRRMIRKVGVGLYRTTETMDATSGEITPPEDFFNQGVLIYAPDANTRRELKCLSATYKDQASPKWENQTGTPSGFGWKLTDAGLRVVLSPQPAATVTSGLIWNYTKALDDLEDDADECPIMNLFPEFQATTLQAGAIRILSLIEGGEADDQFQKFDTIFQDEIEEIRGHINRLFATDGQNLR